MAIINCSECGGEVSSNAEKCPKCSNPISGRQPQQAPQVIIQQAPEKKKGGLLKGCCLAFVALSIFSGVVSTIKEANMTPEERKARDERQAQARAEYEKKAAARRVEREKNAAARAAKDEADAAAARAPDLEISPYALVSEYDQNEVAADMRYKGKRLKLSGTVDDIGKDLMDSIYVTMSSGHPVRSVQIFFADSYANQVATLSKGSHIVIVGRCKGLMMNVLIQDADFVN